MTKETYLEAIREILSTNDLDDIIYSDEVAEWIKDNDDLSDNFNERISEQEIIYYHKAIEYLLNNDASLQQSLELAQEYGYTLDKLSSEVLATLLYQSKLQENVSSAVTDLEALETPEETEE